MVNFLNALVIDYMTKVLHPESGMMCTDAHGRTGKKKKHWEVCTETSQCSISIIGMFFSNIPMFFRPAQKVKRTKETDVTGLIYFAINSMR